MTNLILIMEYTILLNTDFQKILKIIKFKWRNFN